MTVINSYEEFASYLGKDLGQSEWFTIDQERINKFADATLDHQWIHVDEERAQRESPYKSTIAHGYLTLSMLVEHSIELLVLLKMQDLKFVIRLCGFMVLASRSP